MKIITLSAVLCLAAAAVANETGQTNGHHHHDLQKRTGQRAVSRTENQQHKSSSHNEHGIEAHNDGGKKSQGKDDDDEDDDDDDKKKGGDDKKKGGDDKKKGGSSKDVADKKGPGAKPALSKDGKPIVDPKKGGTIPDPTTNPNIPHDYASPLWLVQPYGASVWEQGRAYVIMWGPNPDPVYAKNLKDKSPVDIRLMQGPPEELREIQILKTAIDSSVHMFQWTVPATVPPAKDYSIRISHTGDLDTYSHYFEIAKAGDPRSTKSNVGEPLELPEKGDSPQPLNKGPVTGPVTGPVVGPVIKPATPPNPLPADNKPVPPAAAKPVKPASAAMDSKTPNIMAFVLTLFGAVYLL